MSNERIFPATLEHGDDLVGRFSRPTIPGYTTGAFDEATDPVDVYKVFFSDVGNSDLEREFTATIEAENFVFDIDTSLPGWQARPYHFRISGTWTRDSERRTFSFARGIVQVLNSTGQAVDAVAHSQTMILLLREVIAQKLNSTSDVQSYSIGSRQIELIPVGELRRELRRYENDLIRLRGGEKFGPKVGSANTAPEG